MCCRFVEARATRGDVPIGMRWQKEMADVVRRWEGRPEALAKHAEALY